MGCRSGGGVAVWVGNSGAVREGVAVAVADAVGSMGRVGVISVAIEGPQETRTAPATMIETSLSRMKDQATRTPMNVSELKASRRNDISAKTNRIRFSSFRSDAYAPNASPTAAMSIAS